MKIIEITLKSKTGSIVTLSVKNNHYCPSQLRLLPIKKPSYSIFLRSGNNFELILMSDIKVNGISHTFNFMIDRSKLNDGMELIIHNNSYKILSITRS